MKKLNRILLFIISLNLIIFSNTNNTKFEQIPIGIAQCFLQDSDGFLWIGSQEGLARYDGYELKFYTNIPFDSNSLSANNIINIVEDQNENLWISTMGGGLNHFNKKTEKFTRYLNKDSSNSLQSASIINAVLLDEDGSIWIGTQSQGLLNLRFDSTNKPIYRQYNFTLTDKSRKNNFIFCLFKDSQNCLWIGTIGDGLIKFDLKTKKYEQFINYPNNPYNFRSNVVTSIDEDDSTNIWFATSFPYTEVKGNGIGRYNRKSNSFTYFTKNSSNPNSLVSNSTYLVYIDKSDDLWIGTIGFGLCSIPLDEIYNQTNIEFTNYSDLRGTTIASIFEDKFNSIWIGTEDIYIEKYERSKSPFKWYRRDGNNVNSLSSTGVESIFVDSDNNIWFGHHNTGVTKFDQKKLVYTHFSTGSQNKRKISSNFISTICEDDSGRIWFGSFDNGIDIFDPTTELIDHISANPKNKYGLKSNQVTSLIKLKNGNLLLSSRLGPIQLFDFSQKRFTSLDIESSIYNSAMISILYEDSFNNVWIGTLGAGLYKITIEDQKVKDVKHYVYDPQNENSLCNNSITDIIQSNLDDNYFWIATSSGLSKFNSKTKNFTHYFTKHGLSNPLILKILPDHYGNIWLATPYKICVLNIQTDKFTVYGESDGLPMTGFGGARQNTAITLDGQFLFSGDGTVGFYPDKVLKQTAEPNICFTSFKVFGQELKLDTLITYKTKIKIPYDQNVLTFGFSDLNFNSENKTQFSYKLQGLYNDWINIGDKRQLSLTNLSPGNYKLVVRNNPNSTLDNISEASISIVIQPAWWATWWFRAVVFILFLTIIYSLYQYRINKLLAIERMRVQIAADLHDDVGASLTKISVHSEIIKNTHDEKKIADSSSKIGKLSRELITSFSDIVWSIDARNDRVGDLIDRIREYIDTLFDPENIKIDFNVSELNFENRISQEVRHNIYLIFKEAVNNVSKHSEATEVKIDIYNKSGKFNLKISDDGKGFVNNNKGHHGIENMKLRASKINGEINISNETGTTIVFVTKAI